MELESIFSMYLWIDTKEIDAGMHKFIFYRYLFWLLLSRVIYSKKAFKGKHQFKEKPKSLKRHIPTLTYSLPQQVHGPDVMKQEAEAHSQSLSPKAKRDTGANNQEWVSPGNKVAPGQRQNKCPRSRGGWPAQCTEALRVHIQVANAEGKCSWQYLIMTKAIKMRRIH